MEVISIALGTDGITQEYIIEREEGLGPSLERIPINQLMFGEDEPTKETGKEHPERQKAKIPGIQEASEREMLSKMRTGTCSPHPGTWI